jgi:hypothetical protein
VLVYRMEAEKDGDGPFCKVSFYTNHKGHNPNDGLFPWKDGIAETPSTHYFGCRTLDDLRGWFHEDHCFDLAEHDFCLSIYEVEDRDVVVGGTQVIFRKSTAKLVDQRPAVSIWV